MYSEGLSGGDGSRGQRRVQEQPLYRREEVVAKWPSPEGRQEVKDDEVGSLTHYEASVN